MCIFLCVPVSSQVSRECQFLPLPSHWVSCGIGELYQMERAGAWNPGFIPSEGTVWTPQVHSFPATALLKFPSADWKGTSEGWVSRIFSCSVLVGPHQDLEDSLCRWETNLCKLIPLRKLQCEANVAATVQITFDKMEVGQLAASQTSYTF